MRHRNAGRKLGRTAAHRRALFANLANALIEHERIETTEAKAKDLRRVAEKLVSAAKRGLAAADAAKKAGKGVNPAEGSAINARRNAGSFLRSRVAVDRLFSEIAPRYATRPGGYTRITKSGRRPGDNAPMAVIEFVDRPEKAPAATQTEEAEE